MTALTLNRVLALGLASIAWAGLGCGVFGPSQKETRSFEVDHVAASAVKVTTANGGIDIKRVEGATKVSVTAELQSDSADRLKQANVVADRQKDGTLVLSVEWPQGKREQNEGCSFRISVPDARGVTAETSNGGVSFAGLAGEATANTSNGGVSIDSHDGPVTINTSNGAVTARTISGPLTAKSSNGGIKAEGIKGRVKARTSNGGVTLVLAPECTGPIDVQTENAGVNVTVGTAFRGELEAKTSNGGVKLSGGEGVTTLSSKDHAARWKFGNDSSAEASVIRTSNGSITVHGPQR